MSGEWLAAVVENRTAMRPFLKVKAKEIDIQSELDEQDCIDTVVDLPRWAQALIFDASAEEN